MSSYVPTFSLTQINFKETLNGCMKIVGGSLFIALCSQIKIDLPFTLIPITLQTFAVLLLGGMYGGRQAACMLLTYFTEILLGIPVLPGGIANSLLFVGPKAGYYIGFLLQAYSFGYLVERIKEYSIFKIAFIGCAVCVLQLGLGAYWLALFVGFNHALMMGFYPFILGDLAKVIAVTAALRRPLLYTKGL